MDDPFMRLVARERLAEAEALAARRVRLRAAQPPRRGLRARLGAALIRAGRRLLRLADGDPAESEGPA